MPSSGVTAGVRKRAETFAQEGVSVAELGCTRIFGDLDQLMDSGD